MTHLRQLCCAALLVTLQLPASAGVLMETVDRDTKTGVEKAATSMQVQDGKARIDNGTNANVILFRDATLYMIDGQRKSYMVFDRAAVDRMAGALNDAMAQMRAQMEKMPPEQRAAMENMLKQRGMSMPGANAKPATFDAKVTGGSGKAAGRDCKWWDITRDSVLWQQVCVVPYDSLPGQAEFKTMSEQMRKLSEKLGEAAKQFENDPLQNAALANKLNGVPFITRRYQAGVALPEEVVVKTWKTQSIAAGKFELPAGFTKQELPTMPARPAGNPRPTPPVVPPLIEK